MLASIAHWLAKELNHKGYNRFVAGTLSLKKTQLDQLKRLLEKSSKTHFGNTHGLDQNLSYEDFSKRLPVTHYDEWSELIELQRAGRPELALQCQRFQPTSGSTNKIKWIPYTKELLSEFDRAAGPWLYEMTQINAKVMKGKHFWSLSWLPTHLRTKSQINANDDLALMPWWKRLFMSMTMAVPNCVSLAPTSESSLMATLIYLTANEKLALISVWSPTFALNLLNELTLKRDEVAQILESGSWMNWSHDLQNIQCPKNKIQAMKLRSWNGIIDSKFLEDLWPHLAFISSWDTSTSQQWAKKLQDLFPKATFQGKGLWATEGVVTIPLKGHFVLAVNSHFYEFLDMETQKIHPSWELRPGMIVKPIISTGSGLFRYMLEDKLVVEGFFNEAPCLRFQGRLGGVDMVGEKMSNELAQDILNQMDQFFDITPVSLAAISVEDKTPYYTLICEGSTPNKDKLKEIEDKLESLLNESFHYKLAREINQLEKSNILFVSNAQHLWQKQAQEKGMIAGNVKIEPLKRWNELPKAFIP